MKQFFSKIVACMLLFTLVINLVMLVHGEEGVYFKDDFQNLEEDMPPGWTTVSLSAAARLVPSKEEKSIELVLANSTQGEIRTPAFPHGPASGSIVLDSTFKMDYVSSKFTYLVRSSASSGNLFMHADFIRSNNGVFLTYYDGSTKGTVSDSGNAYAYDTWYRLVAVFHCDSATYDLYVYDIEKGYYLDQIYGISSKGVNVTSKNADINQVDIQLYNSRATDMITSVAYLKSLTVQEGTNFKLPPGKLYEQPLTIYPNKEGFFYPGVGKGQKLLVHPALKVKTPATIPTKKTRTPNISLMSH